MILMLGTLFNLIILIAVLVAAINMRKSVKDVDIIKEKRFVDLNNKVNENHLILIGKVNELIRILHKNPAKNSRP